MEITKQNETFNLTDTTEKGWKVTGTATNDVNGSLSINFNVNSSGELSDNIGWYNVSIPSDGMISLSLSASPKYYTDLIDYSQQALKIVQDYLNNQTSSASAN